MAKGNIPGGSWETPATMVSALVLGAVAAIGHDRLYASFDGRPVGTNLEQQAITNGGTALAFLAKVFFTVATGTAFAQQFFHSLRRKQESIGHLDMLFGLSENILPLLNARLWFRHPVLLVIGLITWCIPLSSVFTPGTINVEPSIVYTNGSLLKPAQPQQSWIGDQKFSLCQLDYTAMVSHGDGHTYVNALCSGPSGDLYSAAVSSVAQRSILPIPPPNQNSSYELTFHGPALACSELSSTEVQALNTSVAQAQENQYLPGSRTILGGVNSVINPDSLKVRYNAWSYTTDGFSNNGCHNLTSPFWHNNTADTEINYRCRSDNNTDYFFLTSDVPEPNTMAGITCQLRNSTYNVAFTYENSVQSVDVRSVTPGDRIISDNEVDYDLPDYGNIVYSTVFDTFNSIVLAAGLNDTSPSSSTGSSSSVAYHDGLVPLTALRDFVEGRRPLAGGAVRATLEAMFQNVTISTLLAPAALRAADADAPAVAVDTWRAVNAYAYRPRALRAAYGAAFGASLLCVAWGLLLVVRRRRGAAYSLRFSTVLRTTRARELADLVVGPAARRGADPLPEDLRAVRLRYEDGDDDDGSDGQRRQGESHGFRVVRAEEPAAERPSQEALESSSMLQSRYDPVTESRGKTTATVTVGMPHDR
ncbi:hypothetical protein F5X96DRAFT_686298 [Biscogniauxia mediterranea]|nr:hypothetical protein F5X96DRAFT_686298 [Biscogniauxia mediterranea]